MTKVREFAEEHIEEDCSSLCGERSNELFFGCTFDKLSGLTLHNCDLNRSKFVTKRFRDALGFTLTLDCHSFKDVEYSALLFDSMLFLLCQTRGNDEKREALVQLLGPEKMSVFERLLGGAE